MTVLFCYVKPNPKSVASVRAYAPEALMTDVSKDQWAYWTAITAHWKGLDDLVTIEQDIEITAEVIPGFDACPEPWCVYEYKPAGIFGFMLRQSLGCTRFRKELQQKV